jgi:copper transport protein
MSAPRRLVGGLIAIVAALALSLGTASPAWAHAALISTTPGDSLVLPTGPQEVTLTFSEPVGLALGNVRVITADGVRVDEGSPRRTDGGKVVRASVRSGLGQGSYLVLWRVISADAHPVSGAFTFSVGTPSATSSELLGRGALTDLAPDPRAPGIALGVSRFLGFAGLVVLLGGALFCLVLWPAGLRGLRRLLAVGAAAVTVSAATGLLLQGPYASGNGLARVSDGALLSAVAPTQYGVATIVRGACALLALVVLTRASGRAGALVLVLLGTGAAAGSSAAGHAGVGVWQPFTLAADLSHLVAVSAWAGGLVILVLGLRKRWSPAQQAAILPGWSRFATWAVVALVVTGTFASVREVGGFPALATTPYGRLLLLKVLIVGGMLLLGLAGRRYVRSHHPYAGKADAPTQTDVRGLRRSALIETGLAVAVLAITAVLVNTTPAKAAYAPPYIGRSVAGPIDVQLDIYPARKGRNGVHIYTAGPGGKTVDVEEVSGYADRGDGERVTLRPKRNSLGHYEDLAFVLPSKGTWKVVLQIRISEIDSYATTQTFVAR